MITSIIFSKDRPLQLDLCLNSIKNKFNDSSSVVVIEKYSDNYIEALDILKDEHKDIDFIHQSDSIYQDVLGAISQKYTCFFTDDNIFYNKFSTNMYDSIFGNPSVCCISLRLGYNIDTRWHCGQSQSDIPYKIQEIADWIFIRKTSYAYGSYWGYSHSVDGHIFRSKDVIEMFDQIEYLNKRFKFKQTPNEVETQMQRFWAISSQYIVCPKHSCVVNSPNNRVSDTHTENFSGEHFKYDPDFLLAKYLNGKRVNMDFLNFSSINCPHYELNIAEAIV